MDWISVEDRLPEVGQRVLVYGISSQQPEIHVGEFTGHSWFYFPEDASWSSLVDVTHWMPLPEAPKQREATHYLSYE